MQHNCDVQFRVYYRMDFLFKANFKNKNMYYLRTIKLIRDIWHEYKFFNINQNMMNIHSDIVFPGGSEAKNLPTNAGDMGLIRGLERIPEEEMATLFSILAWTRQRSLACYSPWGHKEMDMT